jgi:hypothetical protein
MSVLMIPLTAILMPLFLVPTILFMKHRHQRREWEHLERMKEMEERLPTSPVQALGRARGIAAVGAGVPMVSVLTAWLTTITYTPTTPDDSVPGIAWAAAAVISICAMFTGLLLGRMHVRAVRDLELDLRENAKPAYDPDAFDVVSRRG